MLPIHISIIIYIYIFFYDNDVNSCLLDISTSVGQWCCVIASVVWQAVGFWLHWFHRWLFSLYKPWDNGKIY